MSGSYGEWRGDSSAIKFYDAGPGLVDDKRVYRVYFRGEFIGYIEWCRHLKEYALMVAEGYQKLPIDALFNLAIRCTELTKGRIECDGR